MPQLTPHLWFDNQAVEAAEFYVDTFPDSKITDVTVLHDTPSGDAESVSFELFGQPFMAISAGPLFTFNPSISFLVACHSIEEVDAFWDRLAEGGTPLMELGSYPFSDRYGWVEDRYGLSWQVMYDAAGQAGRRITPTLMFTGDVSGKAEEAITFYASLFPDSEVGDIARYGDDEEPDAEGTVKFAGFTLNGQSFAAMDSARVDDAGFNEAISIMVGCEDQDEVDRYWDSLSAVPESEQCGWLKDRYGLSWQIVPDVMGEMLTSGSEEQTRRVTEAFLPMKKLDIATLQRAYDGTDDPIGG
ncbi:MAG: VOC family protein [Actinobacteria bacterium]|nr:VOC family protein [Actinomycetota bacterium]